ncbi:hypothetical protein BI347_21640 [Chromobacterium sphagni]|uniref:Uncharacterized protein n=1 Tax=Chromobacterium sphagni TaxID=1903179 RepID=A0A1S1WU36_9NEIS|nr:hypothetical protein [Chromobacterium sphagni]OHX10392.1 hypothetical protein BI347_21640 [Chromobacterium sphagni]
MSLTTDFLENPQGFMRSQAILIPAQVSPGNGKYQFSAQGAHAAVLQSTAASPNIPGFYAHPVANNINLFVLPTQQPARYYMFTDGMNGCQFLAYGPDRQHITVEHNNFISDPARYAARLAEVMAQRHAYLLHISPSGVNNIPAGQYNSQQGVNIVGEYAQANGWRFWARDRVDQNQGAVYGPL